MKGILRSKKGLAEIITVILIILLSLAAIAIIWQVIKPVILKTTSQISLTCTTGMDLHIDAANCTGNPWTIVVERGTGEGTIKSLKFVFSSATESQTITLTKVTDRMPNELDKITYAINPSTQNITVTNVTSVKIAPVVEGEGGADLPCQVMDTRDCA